MSDQLAITPAEYLAEHKARNILCEPGMHSAEREAWALDVLGLGPSRAEQRAERAVALVWDGDGTLTCADVRRMLDEEFPELANGTTNSTARLQQ